MQRGGWRAFDRLSLAQWFLLGSLVVLLTGMAAVGVWVSRQIEEGVVQRTAATTALYVDSLIAPPLQSLAAGGGLAPAAVDRLNWLLAETPLGREVVGFRVWDPSGRIVYSTDSALVGQRFPVEGELVTALRGWVAANLGDPEGMDRLAAIPPEPLIEIYSPVRRGGSDEVIAAAEFYYAADDLEAAIGAARWRSWLVLGIATVAIYLVLAVFVGRASTTIANQQRALAAQVVRLTDLLDQNEVLHERVRGAAARTTALNERFLRRFSAELHDGPAQEISLALLRLDDVTARCTDGLAPLARTEAAADLERIEASLRRALAEVRSASSGVLLPRLGTLTVAETIEQAVRAHRLRTNSVATVELRDLPREAPLATKIALYRVVQEALANAWRHAAGAGQRVRAEGGPDGLRLEVADAGPGFDPATIGGTDDQLGLVGMRERAESLGGTFRVESAPGVGTRVIVDLPLTVTGGSRG